MSYWNVALRLAPIIVLLTGGIGGVAAGTTAVRQTAQAAPPPIGHQLCYNASRGPG